MSTNPQSSGEESRPSRYSDVADIDEIKVPADLRDLIPYAKYWSIGDDVIRLDVSRSTPVGEKKAMVDAVLPRLDRIEAWCSEAHSRPGPIPDGVCIFEMLSQAFHEVKFEVYPKLFQSPPPPPTKEETAQMEARARLLIENFEQSPAQLASLFGEAAFDDLDSQSQKIIARTGEHMNKIAKVMRAQLEKTRSDHEEAEGNHGVKGS